ncbi:hypothetical protein RRF57_011617 [Xylaria bambusicola]|uniref:Uncharacterized protein n=1 Tax=Xylaria bambusicola TaxID=326684 RepID=A0AAN7UZR9_9PEZI
MAAKDDVMIKKSRSGSEKTVSRFVEPIVFGCSTRFHVSMVICANRQSSSTMAPFTTPPAGGIVLAVSFFSTRRLSIFVTSARLIRMSATYIALSSATQFGEASAFRLARTMLLAPCSSKRRHILWPKSRVIPNR